MKNKSRPKFIVCNELKVYKDMGYREGEGYVDTGISVCECKAFMNNRLCYNRGRCIIARDEDTWKQVSSKTFKGD